MIRESDKIELSETVRENKILLNYNEDELKFITTPLGKAIYKYVEPEEDFEEVVIGKPLRKKWSDYLKCEICGNTYQRSNRHKHKKSKHHRKCEELNKRLSKLLIGA